MDDRKSILVSGGDWIQDIKNHNVSKTQDTSLDDTIVCENNNTITDSPAIVSRVNNFLTFIYKQLDNDDSKLRQRIERRALYGMLSIAVHEPWYVIGSNYLWKHIVRHKIDVIKILEARYLGLTFNVNINKDLRPIILYIYWRLPLRREAKLEWIKELIIMLELDNKISPIRRKINKAVKKGNTYITKKYIISSEDSVTNLINIYYNYKQYIIRKLEEKYSGLTFTIIEKSLLANYFILEIRW